MAGTCGYGEKLSGSINAGNFLTSDKVYWLAWSPYEEMPVSRAFSNISFRVPSKGALPPGSPHRACTRREMLYRHSFFHVSYVAFSVPSKGALLPGSHIERLSVNRALLCSLSKPPVNETPLQVPQRGPYGERCPSPEPSSIYLS